MSTSAPLHAPKDVVNNRYKIIRFIGEGGMQQVYLAQDTVLQRKVALKCPKTSSAEKRFEQSAQLSARIAHANIAATLDYVIDNSLGRPYLIEEHIDGQDLSQLRTRLPLFDPYLVAHMLHHLARAVEASHNAKVFHRDLKPNNIMVSHGYSAAFIKITDFGIARMAEQEIRVAVIGGEDSMKESSTVRSALAYMAPELIQTPREANISADVWSIGAICFELLANQKPFGQGLQAITRIVTQSRAAFPRELRTGQFAPLIDELLALIDKCLVKVPEKRIEAAKLREACDELCYPEIERVVGRYVRPHPQYSTCGFIALAAGGKDVFWHNDSVYGSRPQLNEEVCLSHYQGHPDVRAHPVVKLTCPNTPS
jgi:serine/threonine-protein kinase